MTVGFYSPLPPARTGVADYAAALLGALRHLGSVEVNPPRADVSLYHLGNNPLHRGIYARALHAPGVAVLHDAVLQHFFLGALDQAAYIEEFVYNYGEWHRDLARDLWRHRSRSAQDQRYFDYPMLRRIAEVSRVVVTHNPAATALVLRHAPNAHTIEIPHLFEPPFLPPAVDVIRWRGRHNLKPQTCLYGVFGYLRESKRLWTVLDAFDRVRHAGIDAALLIAGQVISSDLERALAPRLARPGVLRFGHLAEPEFWLAASATDVCINLRHPAAGETSGIAIRLMGIAKPVIVSEGRENARFPPPACLRVPPGVAETELVTDYMIWLARSPEAARGIGRRARAWIAANHALDLVAGRYWETLCDSQR